MTRTPTRSSCSVELLVSARAGRRPSEYRSARARRPAAGPRTPDWPALRRVWTGAPRASPSYRSARPRWRHNPRGPAASQPTASRPPPAPTLLSWQTAARAGRIPWCRQGLSTPVARRHSMVLRLISGASDRRAFRRAERLSGLHPVRVLPQMTGGGVVTLSRYGWACSSNANLARTTWTCGVFRSEVKVGR